ncbi:cell surface protein [Oenococcus sp. UCMA 17063]|nr:cell surface protein [Oenococcus sp. UCMA 17063]
MTAAIVPIQIQATSLTTARAVSNNQSKFQKEINQSSLSSTDEQNSVSQQFSVHTATDKILSDQYTAKGKATLQAAAKKSEAEKTAQKLAASKAEQTKTSENQASEQASSQQATYTSTSYQTSSTTSTTATSSSDNYGISDPSKAWIESVESGGDSTASNGQYQGLFQLSAQAAAEYGGYSGAAADKYVAARYGSWAAAAEHHREYGWY